MKLQEYLGRYNKSYRQFAEEIGFKSPMTVCRYANRTRLPSGKVANRIVEVTKGKVSLKDLFQ